MLKKKKTCLIITNAQENSSNIYSHTHIMYIFLYKYTKTYKTTEISPSKCK